MVMTISSYGHASDKKTPPVQKKQKDYRDIHNTYFNSILRRSVSLDYWNFVKETIAGSIKYFTKRFVEYQETERVYT